MKNRKKTVFLLSAIPMFFNGLLNAHEGHEEDPHYEWFEADEVAVCDDGIYAASNKGLFKLNVVEYDPIGDRYLVRCRCLEDSHLDPAEALSIPYEDISE